MAEAPVGDIEWADCAVAGRPGRYGTVGAGVPVLFLHGWALGPSSYRRALVRLARLGCRVYAPVLPGSGRTARLPDGDATLGGYARWLEAFLDAVRVDEPVLVIGHSFGGGVAIAFAHGRPERVLSLALIDSIGGGPWPTGSGRVGTFGDRPMWEWAVRFPREVLTAPGAVSTLRSIAGDAVPNLIRRPVDVWRVGQLARRAELGPALADLRGGDRPVLVVWAAGDGIVPRGSFDALCGALGVGGTVVPGHHAWLLADPAGFAALMAGPVAAAGRRRSTAA